MYRQELDYRRDKLKVECDKAIISIKTLSENANRLLSIKNYGNIDPMSQCKLQMELLRHLDSFMYPVIEFNACIEILVSQVSKMIGPFQPSSDCPVQIKIEKSLPSNEQYSSLICDDTVEISSNVNNISSEDSHPLGNSLNKQKNEETYITNEDDHNIGYVEEFSNEASEICDKSIIVKKENDTCCKTISSENDAVSMKSILTDLEDDEKSLEINQVEEELTSFYKAEKNNIENNYEVNEPSYVKQEEDIMEIKISDQPSLDVDEDFTILITHIESPSCFHVTCHCPEFESMQLEMSKYYNENIKSFSNMKDKVQQLYKQVHFACLYEDAWLRGMLTDILQFDATCVEAFLLDIGLTIKVDLVDIQPLEECFCILPPQAYLCHLNGVQPLPKDNGQWSGKAIDFMKTLCHTSCIMNVTDSSTKSLEVCLMTMDSIAVNVQLIEDDLAVLKECCESDPSDKIEISVASSKIISNRVENTVTTKLSLQWNKMLFQEGEEFNCYIVFVESPSMFHIILEKNLCEVLSMVDNMVAVCETDKTKYMSKREILECEGGCYACPFRDEWMRGIIFDPLNNEPDFVLMLLIDVGIRIRYHYSDIQFLNKQFYVLEPQAHPCYLFQIEPPFSSNEQKWSRESKKFMRTVQDTVGSIVVVSIDDDRLGVFLKLNDGSILNHNMVEKGLAVAINNDNCKSLEDPPEEFSEMAPTNDLFDDFVENLQGFSSHHDLELCKNYTGPPNTTCFKGSRCKKLHQLPNKDGWTSKKVPEGRLPRSIMDYPSPNTMVFINVTAIRSCTTFYGHVLYIDETNDSPTKGSNALQKNRQPKELTDMMDLINSERVIKSLVPLSSVPCYNELLLCYVSTQEKWFRAVVVDYDETYIVTVFLVDYGIEYTASFKQMKKLDGIFTQLPYQAIEMSLANAECGCIQSGEPHDGMDNLFDMTINKMMTGFVVSSNTEEVGVVLFDEDFTDVGEVLCQKGLLKMVEFTVQESDVNSDLSDNIVKLSSKYQKRHPQSQEEILFGVKQLGFVPAKP